MKSYPLFGLAAMLTLAALLAGCTDPTSHPTVSPPQLRDGITLDTSSTLIVPADQPYIVREHWIIPPGRTVTIQPGTVIMFDSLWWVDVRGRIVAEGTPDNPIVFTSAYVDPDRGQWRGIKLRHSDDGESSFKYCHFTYGAFYDTDTTSLDPFSPDSVVESFAFRGMLCVYNSNPTIEHCIVYYNQNNAISLFGATCAPRVRYNIFTDNDGSAVRADTLVPIADYCGEPNKPDVSYNCVADNSSIPFIYGWDSTRFGLKLLSNANRDSVDLFFNLNKSPQMVDQVNGDFRLTSCSPCVDAGPVGVDYDADGTRADMGCNPYVQLPGELRGVLAFDTLRSSVYYRLSCSCQVDSGRTLYVEPGTQIGVSGLYGITVYGRIVMNGAANSRIAVQPADSANKWDGILITNFDSLAEPSILRYADFVEYQNFEIQKAGTQLDHCGFDHGNNHGVYVRTFAADEMDTVSIRSCTFQHCGTYGVMLDSSAGTVRNCLVLNTPGRGVSLRHIGTAAHVTNCIIRGSGVTGLFMEDFSSPTVINNAIGENAYYGLHMVENCQPTVLNNIIWNNGHYGIYAQLSSTPVLQYNDVWGHTDPIGGEETNTDYMPTSLPRSHSISDNPLFVSSEDMNLADGSPCHDAGDPRPEFNDSDGSTNDMGAYGGPAGYSGVGAARAPRRSSARLAFK
jgi:parallel beta-helix repeat protein